MTPGTPDQRRAVCSIIIAVLTEDDPDEVLVSHVAQSTDKDDLYAGLIGTLVWLLLDAYGDRDELIADTRAMLASTYYTKEES